jgi:uncharacterized protein with HEPN domain
VERLALAQSGDDVMTRKHVCSVCSRCPFVQHYILYLKDLMLALAAIERFVADVDPDAFVHDRTNVSVLLRKFELIETALHHIPRDVQEHHPEIPWESIASMRNQVVHAYSGSGLDYQSLWDAITREISDLKRTLEATVVEL